MVESDRDEATGEVYSGFFVAEKGAWSSFRSALETVKRRVYFDSRFARLGGRRNGKADILRAPKTGHSICFRHNGCAVDAGRLRCRSDRIRRFTGRNRRSLRHRRHKRRWDSVNMRGTYGTWNMRHFRKFRREAHCGSTGGCRVVKKTGARRKRIWAIRATTLGDRMRSHQRAATPPSCVWAETVR